MVPIRNKYICLLIAFLLAFTLTDAQQKQSTKAAQKKEQVERSYKKAYAKARKRTIKHRYEIQTKKTQEMMDAACKRAESFNRQNDPGFMDRIFKRRRPKNR
jgi:hypothetical protein